MVRSAKQMPPGPVVYHPALEPPDADRREDEVGPLDGVVEVGRGAERQLRPALPGQPAQHAGHPLHAVGVEVMEDDLVERQRVPLGEQRPVDQWNAEPSAADDRELHEGDGTSRRRSASAARRRKRKV